MMRLKELTDKMGVLRTEGSLDRDIAGIAYDSRRVTPGMLFFAIPGTNVDGHEYIANALERGASAVVCERNGFVAPRAAKIKVSNTREALALAAAAYYGNPSTRLQVIGVTGTNGKTTVSFMVKQILESAGIKTGLMGTINYEIGERVIPAQRTTPESLEIQYYMAQMLRSNCQACVMEVSSHALDQSRVDQVEFDVGIFTNLTQDHLDYHGTMEAYYEAKKTLFSRLEHGRKPGAAVVNIDDAAGGRLVNETQPEVTMKYGVSESATLRATDIHLGRAETRFTLVHAGQEFPMRVPLIGRHNIYNALAAIGAGLALKIGISDITRAMNQLQAVPGRLEGIECGQSFGVFVDYAHTHDALENVLKTLREITPGRLLLAFGCGGSRDTGKRAKMGKVAAELADYTVITSDNPRKESPAAIALQIEEGFRTVRADQYLVELDRRRAIEEIIHGAKPGDMVLIAGKGHETYQEFEDTVVPFDDRIYARETLENLGFLNKR